MTWIAAALMAVYGIPAAFILGYALLIRLRIVAAEARWVAPYPGEDDL